MKLQSVMVRMTKVKTKTERNHFYVEDSEEFYKWIRFLIIQKGDIVNKLFAKGNSLTVSYIVGNGKERTSTQFSFKGMDPIELKTLIDNNIPVKFINEKPKNVKKQREINGHVYVKIKRGLEKYSFRVLNISQDDFLMETKRIIIEQGKVTDMNDLFDHSTTVMAGFYEKHKEANKNKSICFKGIKPMKVKELIEKNMVTEKCK